MISSMDILIAIVLLILAQMIVEEFWTRQGSPINSDEGHSL